MNKYSVMVAASGIMVVAVEGFGGNDEEVIDPSHYLIPAFEDLHVPKCVLFIVLLVVVHLHCKPGHLLHVWVAYVLYGVEPSSLQRL